MNPLTAILIVARSPYTFRRRHEWRGVKIVRETQIWPLVTIGWWTWDALGPDTGARVADMLDTLREQHDGN